MRAALVIVLCLLAAAQLTPRTWGSPGLLTHTWGSPSGLLTRAPRSPSALPWQHASPGRAIALPGDHRSHPEYRLEWWYYTGHLFDARQRRFGYQLTFFRVGVNPSPPTPSRWAVRDVHMTHLAITDVAGGRHVAAERLNRAGIGWAGASDRTYRVWNEDWRAGLDGGRHVLVAEAPDAAVSLTLEEGKPAVLHGQAGYSRKGVSEGNASHYYSLTRMPTSGFVTVGGATHRVAGTSWMDHEFGTTFLERDQAGWDWFSIQLDEGSELMLFQLRGRDGSPDPHSSGTLVAADGAARALTGATFTLEAGRPWRSPSTGATYPVEWRVRVPRERIDLTVRAAIDAQELSGLASGVAYWEGAVDVEGTGYGRPARGRGYLEMTGYAGRPMGEVMAPP